MGLFAPLSFPAGKGRGLGARRVALAFHRVDGTAWRVALGTSRATRVADNIARLFGEKLGTFDPGFGIPPHEGKAVLEVRSRDVPFILEDGQPVGKLVFEPLAGPCDHLYGEMGSNYQGQGLRLSKHFAPWA
jgi:dCTP deaminase